MIDSTYEQPLINSRAYETLGLPRLKSWEPGRVCSEWVFDERMSNTRGELFGGFYAVLADGISALAAMTVMKPNEIMKTSDLRVSFFRPLNKGLVKIEGIVVNRSRSVVHVETTFKNDQEKILAKTTVVQAIVKMVKNL